MKLLQAMTFVVAVIPPAVGRRRIIVGGWEPDERALTLALRALARPGAAPHRCLELVARCSVLKLGHLGLRGRGVYRDESRRRVFVTGRAA